MYHTHAQCFCQEMRQESHDDTTLLVAVLGEASGQSRARKLCAEYQAAAVENRAFLLLAIEQEPALEGASLAACLRVEDNGGRAERLLALLLRDPQALSRAGWIDLRGNVAARLPRVAFQISKVVATLRTPLWLAGARPMPELVAQRAISELSGARTFIT